MRLQQVLLNYQSNAIKFTPERKEITIICKYIKGINQESDYIEIIVKDEGIGLSEENKGKLFKLFGFIEEVRDTMNTKGIGMGLHITKSIVEKFGGRVWVESKLGKGSLFGLSF